MKNSQHIERVDWTEAQRIADEIFPIHGKDIDPEIVQPVIEFLQGLGLRVPKRFLMLTTQEFQKRFGDVEANAVYIPIHDTVVCCSNLSEVDDNAVIFLQRFLVHEGAHGSHAYPQFFIGPDGDQRKIFSGRVGFMHSNNYPGLRNAGSALEEAFADYISALWVSQNWTNYKHFSNIDSDNPEETLEEYYARKLLDTPRLSKEPGKDLATPLGQANLKTQKGQAEFWNHGKGLPLKYIGGIVDGRILYTNGGFTAYILELLIKIDPSIYDAIMLARQDPSALKDVIGKFRSIYPELYATFFLAPYDTYAHMHTADRVKELLGMSQ